MSRTAFTLRIDAEERNALKHLSKIEGRPINQLLVEAIKSYLGQKGQRERSLEASLANLKEYRRKDPGFRKAIAAFVEAEATVQDPLEGEPIEPASDTVENATGPMQSKVRGVIGAELGRG
jgi:predicted transcriptional regulator